MAEPGKRHILDAPRAPGRTFDLFEESTVANEFADGVGRVFLSPTTTKIELFRLVGTRTEGSTPVEEREVFMRIAFSTPALAEFCGTFLGHGETLEKSRTLLKEAVTNAVKRAATVKI